MMSVFRWHACNEHYLKFYGTVVPRLPFSPSLESPSPEFFLPSVGS
jgi:hypothetical protein